MPTALIVSADAAFHQIVAPELQSHGYDVQRASSADAARAAVRKSSPDAIVVSVALPDTDAAACCRVLRSEAAISAHTAIVVAGDACSREARLATLQAGASDIIAGPLDVVELRLKLDSHTQLKALAERIQSGSLVDGETGLYNVEGLARRIEELGALSIRAHAALACVVLAPEVNDRSTLRAVTSFCAHTIKRGLRHSDVAGRITEVEFAVVAPSTGKNGALLLTQRLAQVMQHLSNRAAGAVPSFRLRTGYDAIANFAYTPVSASDLLVRARRARQGADAESSAWIGPDQI